MPNELTIATLQGVNAVFVAMNDIWLPVLAFCFLVAVVTKMMVSKVLGSYNKFVGELDDLIEGHRRQGGAVSDMEMNRRFISEAYNKVFPSKGKKAKNNLFEHRLQRFQPNSGNGTSSESFFRTEVGSQKAGLLTVKGAVAALSFFPPLVVVLGVFATFGGVMQALPEMAAADLSNLETAKRTMDVFLSTISVSMSYTILGFFLSIVLVAWNSFGSVEGRVTQLARDFSAILESLGPAPFPRTTGTVPMGAPTAVKPPVMEEPPPAAMTRKEAMKALEVNTPKASVRAPETKPPTAPPPMQETWTAPQAPVIPAPAAMSGNDYPEEKDTNWAIPMNEAMPKESNTQWDIPSTPQGTTPSLEDHLRMLEHDEPSISDRTPVGGHLTSMDGTGPGTDDPRRFEDTFSGQTNSADTAAPAAQGNRWDSPEILALQAKLEQLDQDMWNASDEKHSGAMSEDEWEAKRERWQNERQRILQQIEKLRNVRQTDAA